MGTTASIQQPPMGGGYGDPTMQSSDPQKSNANHFMEMKATSEPILSHTESKRLSSQFIDKDAFEDDPFPGFTEKTPESNVPPITQARDSRSSFSSWKSTVVQTARSSINYGLESYATLFGEKTTTSNSLSSSPPSNFPSLKPRSDSEDFSDKNNENVQSNEPKDLNREPMSPFEVLQNLYSLPEIEITKEGFLRKQAVGKDLVSNYSLWKERYFILQRGSLTWYQLGIKTGFELIKYQLECYEAVPILLDSLYVGYMFGLISPQGTRLLLATSTESDLRIWLKSLLVSLEYVTNWKNSSSTTPPPTLANKKSGWLYVNVSGRWKPYFCTLKGFIFEYEERTERGGISLLNCIVKIINEKQGLFAVVTPKGESLNMWTGSSEDTLSWYNGIQCEIEKLQLLKTSLPPFPNVDHTIEANAIRFMNSVRDIVNADKQVQERIIMTPNSVTNLRKKYFLNVDDVLNEVNNEELSSSPSSSSPSSSSLNSRIWDKLVGSVHERPVLNILSLDGGGLRGILNCIILERLLIRFPDLFDKFDMVAGTSNGGMIAMGIAYGFSPTCSRTLIEQTGRSIFLKTNGITAGYNRAKYSNELLKILCDESWHSKTLKEAGKFVVIPAFLLDNASVESEKRESETIIFSNIFSKYENETASDVVMRTTAAPTYFPAWQNYVDGGMFAHDPSSCALIEAIAPNKLRQPIEKITMLSMSTGKINHYYTSESGFNWGYMQWVPRLAPVMWDGMVMKSSGFCKDMLGDRYFRIDTKLSREIPMDDPLQLPELVDIAKKTDLTGAINWIKKNLYQ